MSCRRFLAPFLESFLAVVGIYRPPYPDRPVLYQVFFHYFDHFLAEYEGRFEKEDGFLRTIIQEVVERYLDCGNLR